MIEIINTYAGRNLKGIHCINNVSTSYDNRNLCILKYEVNKYSSFDILYIYYSLENILKINHNKFYFISNFSRNFNLFY